MTQFVACSPMVEVCGAGVMSVVEGMGAFKTTALQILQNHGISDPKLETWYSQQAFLNAFKEIAEKIGQATLRMIGNKVPETALWPPNVTTVQQALELLNVAYAMNHRKGEIGSYDFVSLDERSGKMVCDNPYPCSFDWGVIEATARKFSAGQELPFVTHDDSQPCRNKGGDSCTYFIRW